MLLGAAALNVAFNPHATVMNTVQAGAGGILIGKSGKFIVAKGTKYIQNTPQYQVLKHGYNIQKK